MFEKLSIEELNKEFEKNIPELLGATVKRNEKPLRHSAIQTP